MVGVSSFYCVVFALRSLVCYFPLKQLFLRPLVCFLLLCMSYFVFR